jgi:2-hydroxy-3-oxopropionate reductase
METIGFIGLGVMGRPMAGNLVRKGYEVLVYDLNADAVARSVRDGAVAGASVTDVAGRVSRLITMLPDSPDVRAVILGGGGATGAIAALRPGGTIVDMSTIAPHATREIAAALEERGITFFDAPVSGGVKGATEATLSIMVGGPRELFAEVRPLLEALGRTITWLGESGAGQTAKMCNQMVVAMNIQAICEALAMGRAEGMDLERLREVLMGGAAASWLLENLGPLMLRKEPAAGFRIDLQVKDLKIAVDSAFLRNVPIPGTLLASTLYLETRAHGEGSLGNQAMYRAYDRMSNQGG